MEKNGSLFNKIFVGATCLMMAMIVAVMLIAAVNRSSQGAETGESAVSTSSSGVGTSEDIPLAKPTRNYVSRPGPATASLDSSRLDAEYAVLVDLNTGYDVAAMGADRKIYPASMTKVMTLLVACEAVDDLSAPVYVNASVLSAAYAEGASVAGFGPGERVTVLDLLYGAALPSGADATGTLAIYIAGSEKNFVGMMNEKAAELGLENTHFANVSGLHDKQNYTTPREMAAIMACAMDNEVCRTVMSARNYTTSATTEHPGGLTLYSTAFSRMATDRFGEAKLIAAKTGYTPEAKFCLVSYAETASGGRYVLVSAGGSDRYGPVYDCKYVYGDFAK